MSLVRILYDLRPWCIRSPIFHRFERSGFGFTPAELQAFFQIPEFEIRPAIGSEEVSPAKIDKDGFKVALNMKDFKPGEFVVKTVDNAVIVEGKQERSDDEQGYVSREILRKFILPKNYDANKVESTWSCGVLTITAPAPPVNERIVDVKQIENASETKNKEGGE